MRNFLKTAWSACCFFVVALFLISCCSAYISPERFSYITFFAIAFPYLFVLVLLLAVISFFVKRSLAIVLLLVLVGGYSNLCRTIAFHAPQQWQPERNDSALRLFTWNVQYFGSIETGTYMDTEMIALIADYEPDVVCMQEFSNTENGSRRASIREEMNAAGYKFYFFSNDRVIRPKNATVIDGVAIFSKLPFTDSARININKEQNENLIYTSVLFKNKPLRIYTGHLASFDLYKDTASSEKDIYQITYDRKTAIQYKLRETEQLHQREVSIISKSISKSPYPVIYLGDMNITPCSYNYRLLRNNFQDAFLEKGSGVGATFYKILPTLRIDVCFADTSFRINQCTVVKRRLSDHYPLVTDISWK